MAIRVTGTELYVIDPADDSLLEIGCVTSIDGLDSTVASITVQCIDRPVDEKLAGNSTPGTATIGINFDPSDASHIRLSQLKVTGEVLKWAIGLSDGPKNPDGTSSAQPTVDSTGDFDLPTTRSFVTFTGFISSLPLSLAGGNAVVTSTLSIELSSDYLIVPKV